MNYILLHKSYGAVSMAMTQDKMEQSVVLVAKRNSGDWQTREKDGEWVRLSSIMNILHDSSNKIINWGNRIFSNDGYFSMNIPSAIGHASNKAEARMVLQNSGVKVPRTFTNHQNWESTLPIIARPPYHHGGRDFYVLNNTDDLINLSKRFNLEDWYFAELFQKTAEFRVHVGHGKVLFVQEKPLVEGEIRANQAVNHESWRVLKWSEFHPGICRESIRAVKALGLDYGAVDIMYNAPDDSYAVCEVNTSPSINTPYSSEKYSQYFDWVIRHNFPEHLPFDEDGKNVFYSEMLRE